VYEQDFELSVGETLWIGEYLLTVVEIDDEGAHLRIDDPDQEMAAGQHREFVVSLPR